MREIIKNPLEAICILWFSEPKNINYIHQMLYNGTRNSRVPTWKKELLKMGWIKEVQKLEEDQRKGFYQTTAKAIIQSIEKDLNLYEEILTKKEKSALKKFLDSKYFRENIKKILPIQKNIRQLDFSHMKYYLRRECTMIIFLEKYNRQYNILPEGDTAKIYKKLVSGGKSEFLNLGLPLIEKLMFLNPFKSRSEISDYDLVAKFVEVMTEKRIEKDVLGNTKTQG